MLQGLEIRHEKKKRRKGQRQTRQQRKNPSVAIGCCHLAADAKQRHAADCPDELEQTEDPFGIAAMRRDKAERHGIERSLTDARNAAQQDQRSPSVRYDRGGLGRQGHDKRRHPGAPAG
ncbi:hypothetical protein D9M68_624780 [compost metagenome]